MSTLFAAFSIIYICAVLATDVNTVSSNGTVVQKSNQTTSKPAVAGTNAQHVTAPVVGLTSSQASERHSVEDLGTNDILKSGHGTFGESVKGESISAVVNTSAILTCSLIGNAKQWHQNDKLIGIEDQTLYTIFGENGTLLVHKVGPECSGDFQCSNGTHRENVTIWVKPYVYQPDKKSKNVIEGDPFVVDCKAWGHPSVQLVWYKDGAVLEPSDRITFKDGHSKNSTLRIENVQYEDASKYNCTAVNKLGTASLTMEMQVKDKLAALWPFLGICAEVAILCTIIFIYEKRRTKRMEAEERREDERREEMDRLNAEKDDKVPEELRQRKN